LFTSVFKDKKLKRSHIYQGILTLFACRWKDPDPYKIMIQDAHMAPDPQHCSKGNFTPVILM
jgi:hypothetical protein